MATLMLGLWALTMVGALILAAQIAHAVEGAVRYRRETAFFSRLRPALVELRPTAASRRDV
jgi:hypothetical protein